MKRFQNILLVFQPPNPAVIRHAVALAKRNQGRLTLIDVIEDSGTYHGVVSLQSAEDLQEVLKEARRQEIESVLNDCRVEFADIEIKVTFGDPGVEIIREVVRSHHDLVMKTAAGSYGIRAALFGATGIKLLRKCPQPVWIIKPDAVIQSHRILAAVNVFEEDEIHHDLNRLIVELGQSLSATPEGHLDIVYCWQLPGESILSSGRTRIGKDELDRMLNVAARLHRRKLEEFTRQFDFSPASFQTHLLKGDPGRVIPEFAKNTKTEVLVMGTTGRSGLEGLVTGNTAEKVLNQIDCSILALKPPGFVSPIK